MTRALRELVRAHDQDSDFPYMDFLGAFLLMERWVLKGGGQMMRRLAEVDGGDLLGLPLGTSADDIKLGYVLSLLRSHGMEVLGAVAQETAEATVH